MTELQQNRYDQILRRVGDLKGPGSKVREVLTELFPMIDVENVPGELLALEGTVLGVGAIGILGAAGQTGKIQLFNPVDSGRLVTVTGLLLSTNTTQVLRVAIANASLSGGVATEVVRDLRRGIVIRPGSQIFSETSAGLVNANLIFRLLANTPFFLKDDNGLFVLSPGTGLSAGPATVATQIDGTFFWRERVAQPSELNL